MVFFVTECNHSFKYSSISPSSLDINCIVFSSFFKMVNMTFHGFVHCGETLLERSPTVVYTITLNKEQEE